MSAKRFLPLLELEDSVPGPIGIGAMLQGPSEDSRDFVIADEEKTGFPGLMSLIGMESPGLTAALAIAGYVGTMMSQSEVNLWPG